MKKLQCILVVMYIIGASVSFSQNGWQNQISGVTSKLYDIYFLNSNTGFIVGDSSVILRTTNGGNSWNRITVGINKPFRSIYFPNQNTGYIGGGASYVVIGFLITDRVLLKTTDQGLSWSVVLSDGNFPSHDVYFLNSETGWSSGRGMIKTTNGGLNGVDLGGSANKIYFKSEMEGSYWGNSGGPGIWKTNNGGNNWFMSGNYYAEGGFTFPGDSVGYATGTNGIAKTTDGGNNWFSILDWDGNWRLSNSFINNNTGYTVGHTAGFNETPFIEKTTNGGASWSLSQVGTAPFYSVFMVNDTTVWIAGAGGQILKSANSVNIQSQQSQISDDYQLLQNFPNPFNPATVIRYDLPVTNYISLKVYNSVGMEIESLVNEKQNTGSYSVTFDGEGLSSGIYFYKLEAGDFSETKRMILLK